MNRKFYGSVWLSVTIGVLVISCQPKKYDEQSEVAEGAEQELPVEARSEKILYDQIIELHDEVMPKMNDVMSLKGQIQEKLDLARDAGKKEAMVDSLGNAIKKLEEADEAMMQWMRSFKQKEDGTDHKEVIDYYTDQKKQMEEVKNTMNNALENARVILSEKEQN